MPWLNNATVTMAGPAENGTVYAAIIPADNSFHRWFILEPTMEKEMLATALTAVSTGKKVLTNLSSTDAYSTVNRLYVKG